MDNDNNGDDDESTERLIRLQELDEEIKRLEQLQQQQQSFDENVIIEEEEEGAPAYSQEQRQQPRQNDELQLPLPPLLEPHVVDSEQIEAKLFGMDDDRVSMEEKDDVVVDLPCDNQLPVPPQRLRSDSQDSVFEDIRQIHLHRGIGESSLIFSSSTLAAALPLATSASDPREHPAAGARAETRDASQQSQDAMKKLVTALLVFIAMFGEAMFVMVRDWLETRKSRPRYLPTLIEGNEEDAEEGNYKEDFLSDEERKRKDAILSLQRRDQRMKILASRAKSMHRMVTEMKRNGRHKEAMNLLMKNLEERKKMYGREHKAYAHGLSRVGGFVCESGRDLGTARKCFEEALQIFKSEKSANRNRKYEALILQNLAVISRANGDEEQASREAAQAIALAEEILGKSDALPTKWRRTWNISSVPATSRPAQVEARSESDYPPPLPPNKPTTLSQRMPVSANSTPQSADNIQASNPPGKTRRSSILGRMFHR